MGSYDVRYISKEAKREKGDEEGTNEISSKNGTIWTKGRKEMKRAKWTKGKETNGTKE